ncbi:MAG: HAMP domain-containing histidine kinase [Clostridia bacterium]|nr:HAMP domain-containing histidine kinase [Clostridia bacterium]
MKSKTSLLRKTFFNFILKIFILTILVPVIILIITLIVNNSDFGWLYDYSPKIYYKAINTFNFWFDSYAIFFTIFIIWIIGIFIILYRLLKKLFYYILAISDASNQLFDKEIDYIELPTELKELEQNMNHLKRESEKNERIAREIEQRKNDLIVYLAHDLKTPLTSIIGYLDLLKETQDLSIEQRIKYIEITLDKAYRLEDLMNEFFEIAKFNDTTIVLMKKNLNLKFMFDQLINEFFPLINEQNKNILINCDDNINCFADPDKLSRVFNNIIKNAISYSFENTNIQIDVSCKNELITIYIKNEGYTIPENKLNSIFEKFYRLDDSRNTNNGGAGLGLAIAKEIITLHNGTISAESKDNITTFTLTIPKN